MDLGTHVAVLAGPVIPVPLPASVAARLLGVGVRETDGERSAFSLEFDAGRSGPADLMDSPLLSLPALQSGSRVSIILTSSGLPMVLFDGFTTQVEHRPGAGPGASRLVLTGVDVTWLLDREEMSRELPMDDYPQVLMILAGYAARGIIPQALPPSDMDPPLPVDRVPQQRNTDLAHLVELAGHHGYVTYAVPGPLAGMSTFYWGPPVRVGVPQRAITVGQLPTANVTGDLTFTLDAHEPVQVTGRDTDARTGQTTSVRTGPPTRMPLSAQPLATTRPGDTRVRLHRTAGASAAGTQARAQAEVDRAADAVTATGTLDGARYGAVLRPRGLVGVRGAGWAHDGYWYVRGVEHHLAPGSWTQDFTLARDGHGSTVPAVRP
ncbi:hypothetical protein [Microbacterium sp. A93]|uniref:hypothetical protein n=1 Tax=Microbacterium sp. A93 TaxID=3450716 RepID=UPI003F43A299